MAYGLSKYCNENEAYEAGKAEGRRMERRALLKIVKKLTPMLTTYPLKARLAARSKRSKPKGRMSK